MSKKMLSVLMALALVGAGAHAQEKSEEKGERRKKSVTPLRVQVVFTKFQGEKKVSSLPYTIAVNADDRPTKLRMGVNVPLVYAGKDVPGNVIYRSVGSNVDCSAEALEDGRYKLACVLEQSSIYGAEDRRPTATVDATLSAPMLRTFNAETTLFLRDGQSTQYTAATDPITGEVLKIDVTLNVVK
jgi:Flp pilus assembly secretin CpaC